jgi:hypothetical protein
LFSCARSLGASRAPAKFKSVRSLSVEDGRTSIPEFSFGSVVTDLNKRGVEGRTYAPPNRRGVVAEEEDKDVDAP